MQVFNTPTPTFLHISIWIVLVDNPFYRQIQGLTAFVVGNKIKKIVGFSQK
jgi:hypothetical protein